MSDHHSPRGCKKGCSEFHQLSRRNFLGLSAGALTALAGLGARLAICTNKRTDLSVQLLEALGLAQRFAAIVGADAVAERKPHPDHYTAAVERAGGAVQRSLMVGDTAADVAAGIVGAVVKDPVHDSVAWREYQSW